MAGVEGEKPNEHQISVNVTTKEGVPNPYIPYWTGRIHEELGLRNVQVTAFGQHIELTIESDTREGAVEIARGASNQLLANPVHQQFEIEGENLNSDDQTPTS